MRARTCWQAGTLLALGAAIACAPSAPSRWLYEWTDAAGNVRYTAYLDQIPRDERRNARVVSPGGEDTYGAYWSAATTDASGVEFSESDEPTGLPVEPLPVEPLPVEPEATESPDLATESEPLGSAVEAGPPEAESPAAATESLVVPTTEAPLDARIRELETRVTDDQETLKQLIADPESASGLRASDELREISERLPRHQAELESLREQRDGGGDGGGGDGDGD